MQRAVRSCARAGARLQSSTSSATAVAAPVATQSTSPVAASSAVKLPVLTTEEAAARGKSVTDPGARFSVADTSAIDLKEARTVSVLSDVTEDMQGRRAIIYKATQSPMTSGVAASKHWAIRMNNVDKWDNQLMGWISSTDTLQTPMSVNKFESVEQAVLFCERNGIAYEVQEPKVKTPIAVDAKSLGNQYSYNFVSLELQANMKRAGAKKARHIFANPDAPMATGVSTWVNYRRTDFGPDVWRPRKDIGQGPTAWTGPDWAPIKKNGQGGH